MLAAVQQGPQHHMYMALSLLKPIDKHLACQPAPACETASVG